VRNLLIIFLWFLLGWLVDIMLGPMFRGTPEGVDVITVDDPPAKANGASAKADGKTTKTTKKAPAKAAESNDLTRIQGIGPTYERRLKDAGITTFAQLAATSPEKLVEITKLQRWQAANPVDWIKQAKELGGLD